jgi:hypothetical protein
MDVQETAEKRNSNPKPQNQQHQSEHEIYCYQMGIFFPHGLNHQYKIRKKSYSHERRNEYRRHSQQYWLVATATTVFFMLQIIIGAIQTALGAIHSLHILVTIFGVIATVIGGVLAYLKSRGQPNRARQLRNSLRKVVEEIELQEIEFRNPEIKTTAKEAVDYVNQLYEDARFQTETNYPDFWSTAGTKAMKPGSGASGLPSTSIISPGKQPTFTHNAASTPRYPGPTPTRPAGSVSSEGGTSLQALVSTAQIPSDGAKSLHAPHRAAHVSTRGGRCMNEIV